MSRLQLNFNGGEIDPDERERVDLQVYDSGLSRAENVIARPHGGIGRRGGLVMFAELGVITEAANLAGAVVTMPNGGSGAAVASGGDFATSVNMAQDQLYVVAEIDFGGDVTLSSFDVDGYYKNDGSPEAGGDGGGNSGETVSPEQPLNPPDVGGGGGNGGGLRNDGRDLEQY